MADEERPREESGQLAMALGADDETVIGVAEQDPAEALAAMNAKHAETPPNEADMNLPQPPTPEGCDELAVELTYKDMPELDPQTDVTPRDILDKLRHIPRRAVIDLPLDTDADPVARVELSGAWFTTDMRLAQKSLTRIMNRHRADLMRLLDSLVGEEPKKG